MWNESSLAKLEGALERLVENAFTSLFRRPVSAHDIAVKLARSMNANLRHASDENSRPVAPDRYQIRLHPQHYAGIEALRHDLTEILLPQVIELTTHMGYHLQRLPTLEFVADEAVAPNDVAVHSAHSEADPSSTAMLSPVAVARAAPPVAMHLLMGARMIPLTEPVVNIGRSEDNTVVIDDGYVSRHHMQLRLRDGTYLLFDAESKSGTFVNDVLTREHRLQSGDVIRIGSTRMVFIADATPGALSPGTTDVIKPVEF